jgi:hypothetical protein
MMVRVIVTVGVIVRVGVLVGMRMIVGVGVPVNVLVGMIVTVVVRTVLVVFEDRLHAGSDCHIRLRLRVQLLAEQQHQGRPEEREQRNEPNLV